MTNFEPKDLELPKKFKSWRANQEETIEQIVASDKQLYLLDAPTGSGKSVIGIAASYMWRTNWLTTRRLQGETFGLLPKRVIYVTRTKQLQDQLLADFPTSRTIKGRSNYPCLLSPPVTPNIITAEDCPRQGKGNCRWRESCPYLVAKAEAMRAEIAVLNESYYLTEINGPGQFSGADFVILDEVDSIESSLLNCISVNITPGVLGELNIDPPSDWEDWKEWVKWWNTTTSQRHFKVSRLEAQVEMFPEDKWTDVEISTNKRARRLSNFNQSLDTFMRDTLSQLMVNSGVTQFTPDDALRITISGKETPFVVQEKKDKQGKTNGFELKPVTVRNFAQDRLWRHSQRFLGMSGTILSPVVLARELGLQEKDYDYRQIPSTFALQNRPVYYWPVTNARKKNIDEGTAMPKILNALDRIVNKYIKDKILVHTVSYAVLSAIRHDQLDLKNNERIITHTTEDRTEKLAAFKHTTHPMIMLSPSFDRGVDLPDDQCRCIIICKVPYLDLHDKQVAARLKAPGGDQWYVFKALQTIMQMSGRGVRNDGDHCDTYILDQQFSSLLARTRQYIPKWWLESIKRIEEL
jgi:Rad3-related DNA helicase